MAGGVLKTGELGKEGRAGPQSATEVVPVSRSLMQKIGVWVLFELAFAMLPLVFNMFGLMARKKPVDWAVLSARENSS
jgi:hypothetical protein